ncbi:alpha/beta hydrolase fold domain-containing protein [Dactylosporangium cerinum]|uniref:Alpha/beta hydrolase fold domain-containing protein n=1 Tax=Dactylosporangium cerinum TaxID=1434730 RepID=A0ABV9W1B6_9ACTN
MTGDLSDLVDPDLRQRFLHPVAGMGPVWRGPWSGDVDEVTPAGGPVLRRYRPAGAAPDGPVALFVHGGGFTAGTLEQFDPQCIRYAQQAHSTVVSVGYRLAPAHPFPAAVDDCDAAWTWLRDTGIDAAALIGSSAGAAIAAGLALRLRDRADPLRPRLLLLHAPVLDDRHDTASSHQITDLRTWHRAASQAAWRAYLGALEDIPAQAAPARAADLTGLPPTCLVVGELEPNRDETLQFAARLAAAGVRTELHLYPGAYHGFDIKDPDSAPGRASLDAQAAALARALSAGKEPA